MEPFRAEEEDAECEVNLQDVESVMAFPGNTAFIVYQQKKNLTIRVTSQNDCSFNI